MNLGSAFAQGVAGYHQGTANREARDARQIQATQQAELHKQQVRSNEQSIDYKDQQITKLTEDNKNLANTATTKNLWQVFDGASMVTDFNALIKRDSNMQNLFPGIQSIKPIDMTDPNQASQVAALPEGAEPVFAQFVQAGKLVEKVVDQNFLKIRTGYATHKAQQDAEIAKNTSSSVSQNIMTAAMQTGQPEETLKALELTKPELFVVKPGKANVRRDALKQYTEAFMRAYPNATEEQYQSAMADYVQKVSEGSKAVKEGKDVDKVVEAQVTPIATSFDLKQALTTEQEALTALSGTNKKEYDRIQADITTMKDNFNLSTNIDNILQGTAKEIDTDMVASAIDTIAKLTGIDVEQVAANVDFNTESGMLLADYILSRSGTAASDTEREFLTSLMKSSSFSDEKYVRQALKAFSESLKAKNETLGNNIKEIAPASVQKYGTKRPVKLSREELIAKLKAGVK